MTGAIDIDYFTLALGYSLLIIPIAALYFYKTGLVKDTLIAVARMTAQLLLTGAYLEYIFKLNNFMLNLFWVLMMIIIAAFTIVKRGGLSFKTFILPVFISVLLSIALCDAFFLGYVIRLDNVFYARYFIPISGMMIGNSLKAIIIAIETYFGTLNRDKLYLKWRLSAGATRREALLPFIQKALKSAFNPVIAAMAVIGLISLPGTMTGQILGGSSPNVAIKYQLMLMISIFSSSVLSVVLTIFLSERFIFDDLGNLKTINKPSLKTKK